jgi:hypothetical protein
MEAEQRPKRAAQSGPTRGRDEQRRERQQTPG